MVTYLNFRMRIELSIEHSSNGFFVETPRTRGSSGSTPRRDAADRAALTVVPVNRRRSGRTRNLLEMLDELVDGQAGSSDEAAERTPCNLSMVRYRQCGDMPFLG